MRRDLANALRLRYPALLANFPLPVSAAGEDPDFLVDDGWLVLLDVLCGALQWDVEHGNTPQPRVRQVKEKFGRLRFRVDRATEHQRGMIHLAEELSQRMCVDCGAVASRRDGPGAPRCGRDTADPKGGRAQ